MTPRPPGGRLIAFEGAEASGKSTQAALLAEAIGAVLTFEPGATETGRHIRRLVLSGSGALDRRAEALLLLADRAQHVAEVIRPALEAGRDVVTDRFAGSTLAYQGWGRGLAVEDLRRLSTWASDGITADLVVLLDVDPQTARARAARSGQGADRMEREGSDFHERVAAGYRALARWRGTGDAPAEGARWVVVDGTGSVEEVSARVRSEVEARLGERR